MPGLGMEWLRDFQWTFRPELKAGSSPALRRCRLAGSGSRPLIEVGSLFVIPLVDGTGDGHRIGSRTRLSTAHSSPIGAGRSFA